MRVATRWRDPVRRGKSSAKSPSEPDPFAIRHRRLISDDQIVGRSHRILPRTGIVTLAEAAAKSRHGADNVVQRH